MRDFGSEALRSWLKELTDRVKDEYDGYNTMAACIDSCIHLEVAFDYMDERAKMAKANAAAEAQWPGATAQALIAAKQYGVDVRSLVGTGRGGKVSKADVERAAGLEGSEDEGVA